ncbi:ABC transporter ATP-binding protein [Candidatus Pacearchaeota archaeon]|nr:ABC transporter ATP-binding protein [Candidatus Pacearchaeota archaeon]
MNTEFIQLKDVVKQFNKNLVLDGVNVSIPEGKITGIIGASGEGKSTVLKMIIGFYRPTRGDVMYLKRNVADDLYNINRTFGFATEDGSFYDSLTVLENLHHFGRLYKIKGTALKARAKELLGFVGLEKAENTKAQNLSVGMKKRLDLACSMMHNPKVLIMDEPTADLDPLLRAQILSLIKNINKKGTTVILTTQLLEEMDEICDQIAILCNKKIIEEGDPGKIKAKYNAADLNEVFHKIFFKGERGNKVHRARRRKVSKLRQDKVVPPITEEQEEQEMENIKEVDEIKEAIDQEVHEEETPDENIMENEEEMA